MVSRSGNAGVVSLLRLIFFIFGFLPISGRTSAKRTFVRRGVAGKDGSHKRIDPILEYRANVNSYVRPSKPKDLFQEHRCGHEGSAKGAAHH
jgi:hypothetical protein